MFVWCLIEIRRKEIGKSRANDAPGAGSFGWVGAASNIGQNVGKNRRFGPSEAKTVGSILHHKIYSP